MDITDIIIEKLNDTIKGNFVEYNDSEKIIIFVLWCQHNSEKVMFVLTRINKQINNIIESILLASDEKEVIDWHYIISAIKAQASDEIFSMLFYFALSDLTYEMINNKQKGE